jgi:hypothetical protein
MKEGAPPVSTTQEANFATGKDDKLVLFLLTIFSIWHRGQRHQWCTLSCKYLHKFLNKIETALMGY